MTWRSFLLSVVAAACGGLLLVHQIETRHTDLSTGLTIADEGAYLGWARAEAPELWAASDAQLVRVGLGLCAALEQMPAPAVAPRPVDGLSDREVRAVTDAATRHFCADQRGKVTDYLRETR